MEAQTDFEAVLRAAQRGEEWAFASLYRSYNRRVAGYLRARLGFVDEDLVSEVWVNVARGIRSFSGSEASFRAWIFTITSRRVVDGQRRWARDRIDVVDPQQLVDIPSVDDPATLAVDTIATDDAVKRMVRNLTPEQTDVVLLRVLAGLEVAEVAQILDRTENWVRVTQHRAVRKLAQRFATQAVPA